MKKLYTTEKEKEEDFATHKKDALDFFKRLRAIRKKKREWKHYGKK